MELANPTYHVSKYWSNKINFDDELYLDFSLRKPQSQRQQQQHQSGTPTYSIANQDRLESRLTWIVACGCREVRDNGSSRHGCYCGRGRLGRHNIRGSREQRLNSIAHVTRRAAAMWKESFKGRVARSLILQQGCLEGILRGTWHNSWLLEVESEDAVFLYVPQ
eukprot:1161724-Pelagomonas_calceolata.AAC.2